jgi:hypothetical protein
MKPRANEKYLLDGLTEVTLLQSFQRSLGKMVIELPNKLIMLVEHNRLQSCEKQKHHRSLWQSVHNVFK